MRVLPEDPIAIISNEPCPCDDCQHQRLCAVRKMACKSFLNFINSGAAAETSMPRKPDNATFRRIFGKSESLITMSELLKSWG